MAVYSYEALNYSGETVQGEMEASAPEAVVEQLQKQGFLPITTKLQSADWSRWLKNPDGAASEKLSRSDMVSFTRELSTMLRAGLSLDRSLETLIMSSQSVAMTKFLRQVQEHMRSGSGFADALAVQKETVPLVYIEMIRAGELGGAESLRSTLDHLALYLGKAQKIRETIMSAMIYPIILICVAVLSIVLMLAFVLPQFEPLFQSAGDAVPFSARLIMSIGHHLRIYGMADFVIFLLVVFGTRQFVLHHQPYRLKWEDFKLHIPLVGGIVMKTETANFCRTLGALLSAGVSMTRALPIVATTASNRFFALTIERISSRVREGASLSTLFAEEKTFPILARQMMGVGEETGQMNVMLLRIANIYDQDVSRSVERFMALLTPAITIILGIVIAVIIASLLSAILSVNDLVS
jgi:general secretion pathway protein F